jgi:hypothetical protein
MNRLAPAVPAVIVHGLAMAEAALAPGRDVTLLSAEGAAVYAGVGWWRAMVAAARASHPAWQGIDLLDCGFAPGRALEALRHGQKALVLRADPVVWTDIEFRAGQLGALLLAEPPPALDLGHRGALRHLPRWLDGMPAAGGA